MGSTPLSCIGSKTKGEETLLLYMVDDFYDKNMDKDESVIFWFYQFGEKHTYTYNRSQTLTQGQILLDFLLFTPLRDLEKLLPWRLKCYFI